MLQLEQHVSAESEHPGAERRCQRMQASLTVQPEVAEKKRQPHMRQGQILDALVAEPGAPPGAGEHQPGGRIKKRGLRISGEAQSGVDGRIPLRKAPLMERLERVVEKRIVKFLEVERDVHTAE